MGRAEAAVEPPAASAALRSGMAVSNKAFHAQQQVILLIYTIDINGHTYILQTEDSCGFTSEAAPSL